jgi:2-hydroxychromene-2-carboxylate isomerase
MKVQKLLLSQLVFRALDTTSLVCADKGALQEIADSLGLDGAALLREYFSDVANWCTSERKLFVLIFCNLLLHLY